MDLLPWRETSLSIRCSNNRFIFYRCQRKLGFIKLLWPVVCYDCTASITPDTHHTVWYNRMFSWWYHENPMSSASQVILSVVELPAYIYAVIIFVFPMFHNQQYFYVLIWPRHCQIFLFLDVLQLFSDVVDRPLGKEASLLPLSHLHWGRPHCICFHWGLLIFIKLL